MRINGAYFMRHLKETFLKKRWAQETYANKGENYTSTAKRIHTERRQYWSENDKRFESLRIPYKLD